MVQDRLRPVTLDTHQWSVNLSGACALGRWMATLEPLVADGTLEPMVVGDIDLVNIGNVEWPTIRKALQRHFPEACAWTDW